MTPIKRINVNKLVYDSQNLKTSFEINPLDINLTKMQENLINRLEHDMYEHGDFAPIVEKYDSKNPNREFSTIEISCVHDPNSITKTVRDTNLSVKDKPMLNEYVCTLHKGTKQNTLKYISSREFFETTKKVILMINDMIKSFAK